MSIQNNSERDKPYLINTIFCDATIADTKYIKQSPLIQQENCHIVLMMATNKYLWNMPTTLMQYHCLPTNKQTCIYHWQHPPIHLQHTWKETQKTTILYIGQWGIKHHQKLPYSWIHQPSTINLFHQKTKEHESIEQKEQSKISQINSSVAYFQQTQIPYETMGPTSTSGGRLPQMLHISCDDPSKSSDEILNGKHNFNTQPWAPPGCKEIVHEHLLSWTPCAIVHGHLQSYTSWSLRGTDAWYTGSAKDP